LSSENLRGKKGKKKKKISSKKDGCSMGSYACYSSNFSTRVQDKHSIIFQGYKPIGNMK
jgi:hypothetical protein